MSGSHKILQIDAQGNQFEWVSYSSDAYVESIRVKNDKIFVKILKIGNNRQICAYDLWSVYHILVGNQVIVCNVGNKRLTVYSP